MKQGSVVFGGWNMRGRLLAAFELTEDNLTEWQLHSEMTAGRYAVVKWDEFAEPSVVPMDEIRDELEP